MLTPEQIDQLDKDAATKGDLEEALHAHGDDFPGLLQISENEMKRAKMIDRAKAVVDPNREIEMSAEEKVAVIENVLEHSPEAVVYPATQAFLRIDHPTLPNESVTITVFTEMGNKPVENARPQLRPTEEERIKSVPQLDINTAAIDDLPKWAFPKVHDLIQNGTLALCESAAAAQQRADDSANRKKSIVESKTGVLRMRLERAQGSRTADTNPENQPLVNRPSGEFKRPEQQAAWNLMNKNVAGSGPLPEAFDEVSSDPAEITEAEVSHVERRITKCLERPASFLEDGTPPEEFEEDVFFSQLLSCELRGFTAQRPTDSGGVLSGTRPQIVRLIRSICKERGFEIIGDGVRPAPDKSINFDVPDFVSQ